MNSQENGKKIRKPSENVEHDEVIREASCLPYVNEHSDEGEQRNVSYEELWSDGRGT